MKDQKKHNEGFCGPLPLNEASLAWEKRLLTALAAGAILLLTLHAIAAFSPLGYGWGFHALYFYPIIFKFLFLAAGLLLCLPWKLDKPWSASTPPVLPKNILRGLPVIAACIVFILFWLFRAKTHFLGDGYFVIRCLAQHSPLKFAEPLDDAIHKALFWLIGGGGEKEAELVYAFISCLCGGLYVFLAIRLANLVGKSNGSRAIILLAIIFAGNMQLFCGYVESYSIMHVGILAYCYTAALSLYRNCPILIPSCILTVTASVHLGAASLAPSLFLLMRCHTPGGGNKKRFIAIGRDLASIAAPFLAAAAFFPGAVADLVKHSMEKGGTSLLLPLFSPAAHDQYAVFSIAHILDFCNEILLVSPWAALLLAAVPFASGIKWMFNDRFNLLLFIASLFSLLFTFIINAELGISRDWDLLAFPAVPLTVLGGLIAAESIRGPAVIRRVLLIAAALFIVHTVPWIALNSSARMSLARFEYLTASGTVLQSHYAHEEISIYYRNKGSVDKAIEHYEAGLRSAPQNERLFLGLAFLYSKKGDHARAIEYCKKAIELNRNYAPAYINLAAAHCDAGEYDTAIELLQKVIMYNPRFTDAYIALAKAYKKAGKNKEMKQVLEQAIEINPSLPEAGKMLSEIAQPSLREGIP